ncbi:5'-adenylylsulfate reductase-like 4 [Olea europaea var. sylvestris]|uniref:5 -adenylylsulfate reductase-like 4 n=1 Tax=Olea europaea subsp. europaea TaxID=158383 RepID=A0A8S0RTM5_OLEEU|nr:5'-adenylylsulfate reductase-like 4 [Olea europaea var. sylvestris]CAA2983445.1 5 -adenylylsulfate reductase-like 4 [Olea europaea subsp. europaea]
MENIWRNYFSAGLTLFLFLGKLTCADPVRVSSSPVCPLESVIDSILGSHDFTCSVSGVRSFYTAGVIEGNEVALQKALHMVHKNTHDYVALLFYASWCPFSGTFRPSFSVLSSLFPSVPHFAIEESAVRPSILSKYGVHGLPTLFLLNSTTRVRYHGSRTLDSLVSFYGNVTGMKTASVDGVCLDKIGCTGYEDEHESYKEICPFPWARFPENLLQQETCLALATLFVILRLLYFFFPTLRGCAQLAWRRCVLKLGSSWEHPVVYLNRAIPLFNSLKEPCKKSNLQEGAKNAKVWASKSLASVSFGDASSSHDLSVSSAN